METVISSFMSLAGVASIIILLSELIDKKWHLEGNNAQARTWVLGVLIGLSGYVLQLGIFATPLFGLQWMPLWLVDSLLGLLAAYFANYGFDKNILYVKIWLELLKIRVPVTEASILGFSSPSSSVGQIQPKTYTRLK